MMGALPIAMNRTATVHRNIDIMISIRNTSKRRFKRILLLACVQRPQGLGDVFPAFWDGP
jgi:hypothetical protein